MNHLLDTAASCGLPKQQFHRDYFAVAPIDHEGDQPFEVELAISGQVLQIPAYRSIFEVLDEASIEISSSCEQGVCGSSITRVLQGGGPITETSSWLLRNRQVVINSNLAALGPSHRDLFLIFDRFTYNKIVNLEDTMSTSIAARSL
ncbi:2Fe-2S iron-sulfur cluster-binding protein [Pseudomonas tolaasii]|uniref:2Fe-2S iron-sulfur cluster-binding protein n=1 Tax=Pseudomonas tolaasii TaxID=29442 RepID=UPI001C5CF26B|nr:2Fe-2S iron-sulfur cluster binding domain-containing protein [Pseudomonas tolaasii]MBW4793247.1 2Fe-2S iron-sulfur cluster binding domain-containing protein [Pseudomonas tolaasii]